MTPKQYLPEPYVLQFKYKVVVFKSRMFSPFIYLIFADKWENGTKYLGPYNTDSFPENKPIL